MELELNAAKFVTGQIPCHADLLLLFLKFGYAFVENLSLN
jgi:hypothetical protein